MSKYYYLISGLPTIALDDSKLTYSVLDFRNELDGVLSYGDKKLIDLFFLKFDNKNVIEYANHPDHDPDLRGSITFEEFNVLYEALKNEELPPINKHIPPYFLKFFKQYLAAEAKGDNVVLSWEDRLVAAYYGYAAKCRNRFVREWFELNLNISNMLTAITCRKHGFDKNDYIVGENDVAECIRTSNARDFGLGDMVDYLPALLRIAEESDLMMREKKIDLLKWQWLDDQTFFKPFDIESVFSYLLKLEMIERWVTLDRATGEKTFRSLVGAMKKGSVSALEEFKRNNNK
ncbi:MAG: DUF2764 domain-containing protein [Tannerellaceae bacterium]